MNRISDWLCSDGSNPCEARRFTTHLQDNDSAIAGGRASIPPSLGTRCVFQLAGARLLTRTIALPGTGYHDRRRCRVTASVADVGRARLPLTVGNKSSGRRGGIRASKPLTLKVTAPVKPVTLLTLIV